MHEGRLCGVEVVAVVCGVCKVNAAIASQLLIDDFAVGAILNSGTAGGMDPRLRILDTVISTEVCYHDVAREVLTEFHPWMASPFFQADPGLLELSRAAVRKSPPPGMKKRRPPERPALLFLSHVMGAQAPGAWS